MAAYDANYAMGRNKTMTPSTQREQLSIGFGCSSRASVDDILCLIHTAIHPISSGTILATLDRKWSIAEIVATKLGLTLMLYPATTLACVKAVTTRSPRALIETQTASVAEAAALASLGVSACLVVPQIKGRCCTCAVASLTIGDQP